MLQQWMFGTIPSYIYNTAARLENPVGARSNLPQILRTVNNRKPELRERMKDLSIGAVIHGEDIPARQTLTEDMVFCGPVPEPLSRERICFHIALRAASRLEIPFWRPREGPSAA
jgi:hypothetical protein